jgi:hypothetical protein
VQGAATRAEQAKSDALETLRLAGVNPDDPMVARIAAYYRAHDENVAMEARTFEEVSRDIAALEKVQELIGSLKVHKLKAGTLEDLRNELARRKTGLVVPKRAAKVGHPVDLATRRALLDFQSIAPWKPEVIEACLVFKNARGVAREPRVLRGFVEAADEAGDHGQTFGVIVKQREPK